MKNIVASFLLMASAGAIPAGAEEIRTLREGRVFFQMMPTT